MSELIYRPGLDGVIAGTTKISSIADGLRYRGYSIEELASHATFEEVAYVVLYGERPSPTQLDEFKSQLSAASTVPSEVIEILQGLPKDSNMMDMMRTGVSVLGHWEHGSSSDQSSDAMTANAIRLFAQLPIVLAASYRIRNSQAIVDSRDEFCFAKNLLWMLNGTEPTDQAVRAVDVSLILYAEHEFNASTFTARVVTSTLSDMNSAVSAAVGALKGPLHGGANERVMEVLREVIDFGDVHGWVAKALQEKRKIMGFGHRVYKTGDPRAKFLKPLCKELADQTNNMEFEEIADVIESTVWNEKSLAPNLDWPSARLYYYLGLPIDLYTPLFVVSRITGWCAHIIEQRENNRIIRPRSQYEGPDPRAWGQRSI